MMNWNSLLRMRLSAVQTLELQRILTMAYSRVMEGQGMELSWRREEEWDIKGKDYLEMAERKTGALIGAACEAGAYIGGGTLMQRRGLKRFGEEIGVAFQIQDDILNLIGEEFVARKGGAGEDITEGKRTLMVIHTLRECNPNDAKRLIEILDMHTLDQKLRDEAIAIMKKHGAMDYGKEFARKILKEAWKEVDETFPLSEAKEKIKAFADYLVERDI